MILGMGPGHCSETARQDAAAAADLPFASLCTRIHPPGAPGDVPGGLPGSL